MFLKEYDESYYNLKNVERFCTKNTNPRETSPLCAGTTFNIEEYLVTQNTYQQLSVVRRDNLKYTWFSTEARQFCIFLASCKKRKSCFVGLSGRQSIVRKNSSRNGMVYYPPSWQRAHCSEC